MFLHWGPYSALAGEWKGQHVPVGNEAEWIMQRFNIPVAEYRERAKELNPVHFDAEAWVALAKATGMKYLVVTAKHHDGFAMYDSKVSKYNIVEWTPFHRDPLWELADACKKAGIRFCVYYSHREDWDDPNGYGNNWDYDRSKKDFNRYLEEKSKPQLRELLSNYGPVGLVWFDRGMDTPEHTREFVDIVRQLQPRCLINGRVGSYGMDLMGDYQNMNDNGMPSGGLQEYWETPQTLNTTWGYSRFDQQWKTPGDVIHRMVEIVSKGGNYLLNIGPMADGTIPAPSVATLRKVGAWVQANGESIYGTSASPVAEQPWGRITVKGDKLYLHVFSWPGDGILRLPGVKNDLKSAYALADPTRKLALHRADENMAVTLPAKPLDEYDTVVVLQLDGAPKVDPPVVTQGSDSPFELDYQPAVTSGRAVKRFNRDGKFHIAKWSGPADTITWHLLVSQTGVYHARITYSARQESNGAKFAVTVAGQTLTSSVAETGEGYHYKTFDLGAVKFEKVGSYTVEIKPAAESGTNLMFFQKLDLVPEGPLMID
ncbi:MAG: alpha-L-fucosidase [Terracidiphilus sp.]|nr:alpha-L-fucosidase [Terracidiphilus sp.]